MGKVYNLFNKKSLIMLAGIGAGAIGKLVYDNLIKPLLEIEHIYRCDVKYTEMFNQKCNATCYDFSHYDKDKTVDIISMHKCDVYEFINSIEPGMLQMVIDTAYDGDEDAVRELINERVGDKFTEFLFKNQIVIKFKDGGHLWK